MPRKFKQTNQRARIKAKSLNSNYNCEDCNAVVNYKYITCPKCAYVHQGDKARNSNPIIK